MPDRFIALPVSQGDAFYLERGNWSVLVDGGRYPQAIADFFRSATGKRGVDVLVCTHNDADHANGVLGFLEASMRCREVWLPGRWLATLPDVLKPAPEIARRLYHAISELPDRVEASAEDPTRSGFEDFADSVNAEEFESATDDEIIEIGASGWPESVVSLLENARPWRERYHGEHWHYLHMMDGDDFFRSAMDAAERIRAIALAAFHRGIPVRWFEHDASKSGGGTTRLRPVNAQQIARVIRVARVAQATSVSDKFLAFLALTVANKESLVFCSPGNDESPAVLFTADSDLAKTTIPRGLNHAIVTAPHHGSESNFKAYGAVTSACGVDADSLTWVRSDGRYRSRPGPAFLKQPNRFCTMCRQASTCFTIKDAVHLSAQSGTWCPVQATCSCSCK